MFAAGGFLFILGRLMIAALCAFVAVYFLSATDKIDGDGLLILGLPAAILSGIGAWSVFVVARSVWRDAFGRAQEDGARLHHGNGEADGVS